jgi:hypothetical protein
MMIVYIPDLIDGIKMDVTFVDKPTVTVLVNDSSNISY